MKHVGEYLSMTIYYWKPFMERLKFHLTSEQFVVVKDDGSIEEAINKEATMDTMLTAWMKKKKKKKKKRKENPSAKKLT